MNEIIINSTNLINGTENKTMVERAERLKEFKDFIKQDMVDGVDFGVIPNTDKPCLLKSGMEKVLFYLGLTPVFTLTNRVFTANQHIQYKEYNTETKTYDVVETIRNYYSWEWKCELFAGDSKVSEGVGMGNTEEKKYVNQYKKSETPDGLANTVMKISKKRALGDAVLAVGGISDLFTVDLEDNETINKMKVDKTTKPNKLTKEQRKQIYATLGALDLISTDLEKILNKLGFTNINEVTASEGNKIVEAIKVEAKSRKNKKTTKSKEG
jgi:hypothetical protein